MNQDQGLQLYEELICKVQKWRADSEAELDRLIKEGERSTDISYQRGQTVALIDASDLIRNYAVSFILTREDKAPTDKRETFYPVFTLIRGDVALLTGYEWAKGLTDDQMKHIALLVRNRMKEAFQEALAEAVKEEQHRILKDNKARYGSSKSD